MKKCVLHIIVLLFAGIALFAQSNNAIFDHITIEDGLSHSLINRVTQDSTGYIWVATQEGLNRFDGYSIKAYKKDEDSKNFTDNWITCVITDSKGNVWYGTRAKGIGKYDERINRFTSYDLLIREKFGEAACKIQDIVIDSDTCFWVSTWGAGLLKFNPVTLEIEQYINDPNNSNSISENRVYTSFTDSNGDVWVGTHRTGLNKLDPVSGKFINFRVQENFTNGLTSNFIVTIEEDYTGKLWIGTYGGGVYCFDRESDYFSKICNKTKIADSLITKIFEDSEKIIWICTDGNGIYRYDRENDKYDNFRNIPSNRRSLNDNRVWSVMEDNAGILWFGSFSGGLNIYNKNKNIFEHQFHIEDDPNTIVDNFVKNISQDSKGNIWIGTNRGISIIDHETQKIKNYTEDNGLPHSRIRKIYEDKNGLMWIATWGGGLLNYDSETKKFSSLKNNPDIPNSLADDYLKGIIQHPNGKYYIGSEIGLNEYDPLNNSFKIFEHDENDSTSLSNPQISVLFIDSKNRFWIGTQYGLNLFNVADGTFKRYMADSTNKGISNYRVSEVYEDSKGTIWIGTYGGGLNIYDDETETFTYITEKDGLSNNSIYEILEDDSGNYWVSTNRGLTAFNLEAKEFRVFTKQDGLQENEFNGGAALKTNDGKFYFGGVNGISTFYPDDVKRNLKIPTVVLTDFEVSGDSRPLDGKSSNPKEFQLNYDENFLNFEFAALDFTAPRLNKYKYMLTGLEDDWNDLGNIRRITYTNLDPGTYTLHVIASNNDNVWNTEGIKLSFTITPPWWGTTLFRICLAASIILLIFAVVRIRLDQIKKRQKILEMLVEERTEDLLQSKEMLQRAIDAKDKLFSIVAHDLKNPFLPLLGYSEMLAKQINQLDKVDVENSAKLVHESARSIYSLLENLLDWARIQLNKFEYQPININLFDVANEVFELYKVISGYKKVALVNNLDKSLKVFADIDMLKTVLRNIISNSVKYCAEADSITISAVTDEHFINVIISDTGSGIESNKLDILNSSSEIIQKNDTNDKDSGTGLGLILVKELVEIMNGQVEIKSVKGEGTDILLKLPAA